MRIIIAALVLFSACTPSPPYVAERKAEVQDSIPEIVLSEQIEPIEIKIVGDTISIKSKSINTKYVTAIENLKIQLYDNDLTEVNLNGEVNLLKLQSKYHYLDANVLVVQKGQTLSQIVKDHRIILNSPELSVEKIKSLNNLKNPTINAGQELRIY